MSSDSTVYSVLGRVLASVESGEPIPALTADEIDCCLLEFEQREVAAEAAMERVKLAKLAVIALVQQHGAVVPTATESKRVLGRRNQATVTTPKLTTVDESAVDELGTYCAEHNLDGIFDRIFSTEVRHKLIDGARKVLASLTIAKRHHDKIEALFGRCFHVTPKAPSLKVDVIKPEKPARKARAQKVGA